MTQKDVWIQKWEAETKLKCAGAEGSVSVGKGYMFIRKAKSGNCCVVYFNVQILEKS